MYRVCVGYVSGMYRECVEGNGARGGTNGQWIGTGYIPPTPVGREISTIQTKNKEGGWLRRQHKQPLRFAVRNAIVRTK